MADRKELHDGAWYTLESGWLSPDDATDLFARLHDQLAWEQRTIYARGTPVVQPRLMDWSGELPYHYSGQTLEPRPHHPLIVPLLDRLRSELDVPFNHVVANLYRDGSDRIGFHADNEPELGRCPVIAAVSLGIGRKLALQLKRRRKVRRNVRMPHGSLLVMGGTMQHTWRHAVLSAPVVTEPRINLTFRWLKGPPGWRQAPEDGPPAGPRRSR